MRSSTLAAVAAAVAALTSASSAAAATLTVDDDRAECPAAAFTSVQAAVDAAVPGQDTVAICPGAYAEGSGAVNSSALTISKDITIKGAGADLVSITPVSSGPGSGRILGDTPNLRNGLGDVVAVVGTPTKPLQVDISGVTVDGYDPNGRPVAVEAGIVFVDASGSIVRSRVTNVVTSEGDNAFNLPGGWRNSQPGVGIAQTSNAIVAPSDGTRFLRIDRTRVDKYNKYGILIDGAQNDAPPYTTSGVINAGVVNSSQVIGRTECINYLGTGNCSNVGLLTTGPLFGQDGVRVTSNGRAKIAGSTISQNLVNGTGAPTRSTVTSAGVQTNQTNNNANLTMAAGVRMVGASLGSFSGAGGQVVNSSISFSNIVDNAYGAMNLAADGTTTQTGNPSANPVSSSFGALLKAENNWWGLNYYKTVNPGPAIAPTYNPPVPENPVTGTAVADGAGTTSNSVDFFPFRAGNQADPTAGEFTVAEAPLPVDDAAPTVDLSSSAASAPRGSQITLTAIATDDFGVKSVRFSSGAEQLGTVATPPYRLTTTIPADAACNSQRTYTALATDSDGQTASKSVAVTATCPAPPPDPGNGGGSGGGSGGGGTTSPAPGPAPVIFTTTPPSISISTFPAVLTRSTILTFSPKAPAGVARVDVFLGSRQVCALFKGPYACRVNATGADPGSQIMRVVLTDATGATAETSTRVSVQRFAAKLRVAVRSSKTPGGRVKRRITGTLLLPTRVTKTQACSSGRVTVVIKRAGRSISNQQLTLSKGCSVTKTITGPAAKQSYSIIARFGGNTVLRSASTNRRFS